MNGWKKPLISLFSQWNIVSNQVTELQKLNPWETWLNCHSNVNISTGVGKLGQRFNNSKQWLFRAAPWFYCLIDTLQLMKQSQWANCFEISYFGPQSNYSTNCQLWDTIGHQNLVHIVGWQCHPRAKPHIFVLCPFRNYYPILFQLGTWYFYGNIASNWCCGCGANVLEVIFLILQYESLLITQYVPKLAIFDNFWQFCLLYLDLLFII